jgi:hypothetical protein
MVVTALKVCSGEQPKPSRQHFLKCLIRVPFEIDVSAEEAIAITLIGIQQTLTRLQVKAETAFPDFD